MKTKNEEKPTLYFITGHRGAGKTTAIADLLPDHPFIPHVYQHNEKMRKVWNEYRLDEDLQKYIEMADCEMDMADNYIQKQMSNHENIYIELDCAARLNMKSFENLTQGSYNTHIIFVLCDNLQESVNRVKKMSLTFC